MEIPYTKLSDDSLNNLIVDYVSHSDDNGFECSLDSKVQTVKKLLMDGSVIVTFDPSTESCFIQEKKHAL